MPDASRELHKRRQAEQGFTLLELMVTLGVFMFVLIGMSAMQLATLTGSQRTADTTLATNLASSTIENLRVRNFDDLVSSGSTTPQEHDPPQQYDPYGVPIMETGGTIPATSGGYFAVVWAVEDSTIGSKNVTVTVTWTPRMGFDSSGSAQPATVVMASKIAKR